MTAGTIINSALRDLKVLLHPGQTAAPEELADALVQLNNLVDSWSTLRLLIPYASLQTFALVPAKAAYNIGQATGYDAGFNVARPLRIDAAAIVQMIYNGGSASFRTDLEIVTQKVWAEIRDKTATADMPSKLYYQPSVPNGILNLWPIPNVVSATNIEISSWVPLAAFPDQTTDVPLAPGYARALIKNLCVEIAALFPGAQLSQAIVAEAQDSKESIMKLNALMVPETPDIATPPATSVEFRPVPSQLGAAVRLSQPGTAAAIQAAQEVKG